MRKTEALQKKILVIDDNTGILFIMREALLLKEYSVHVSETFAGIDAVIAIAPDLIFLDVSLIGHDGRDVAKILKGHVQTKRIPIIILTAYLNVEALAKEARADACLSKPFELERLWEIAEKYSHLP
jgi:CheY-like chemotaxis protein